ncbi:uncharacterized protein MYCGRDRAFT_44834 [Zymoseptoria tritici IPO323]|uniref:Uncharacterized protein n=1 Tax=Zymoseptoria tritici (strain CBS 115943 / IPO323) TaxID=336722 RepID=F9XGE5_ZYMTI|nr:uncharacterized protein MYCGRDRAFT_44834 [Zymoseptoria tritici IPO323]EGP85547.1 hypothetical protein MYCGRDRAFT_44834 [Zymoseptoria tritici IPO323]
MDINVSRGDQQEIMAVWNAMMGEQTQKLEGHDGAVSAVAFSPDGQVIVSASFNKTVRLWNATMGEMIQLIPNAGRSSRITFAADGKAVQTDTGIFLLEQAVSGLPGDFSTWTTSLELRDQWICNRDKDLLWLPYEYRGYCSAIHKTTLAIGQPSSAVSIFRLR